MNPRPSTSSRLVPKSVLVEVVVSAGSLDDVSAAELELELLLEEDFELELDDFEEGCFEVIDGRVTVDSDDFDLRVVVVVVVVVDVDFDDSLVLELGFLLLEGDFVADVVALADSSSLVRSLLPRVSARPIATATTSTRAVATAPIATLSVLEFPEFFCADIASSSQI